MAREMSAKYSPGNLSTPGKVTVYTLLIIGSAFFLFPVIWMLATSLKTQGAVSLMPPQWIPHPFRWRNFIDIFTVEPVGRYLLNTVCYSLVCVVGSTISCALVAFGFARLRARGKNIIFGLVLATMMVPAQVTMIPQYLEFVKLGWINTYLPLTVPAFFAVSAFNIFLLRQFFAGIPRELDEAVKVDGGGYFTTFFRVILPLSTPALATVGILEFMARWNDLMGPLIYLNTTNKFPIALGLANFSAAFGATPWNLLMAASVVAVIPLLILFFLAQKYFIKGIVINASK
ncbi:carbohydrate ABC transporter permease [Alicyclobacillus fastidiosus]|uniref:Carbohydrate ABC transporter permease n=1 Tax=Alicyclobacillus fastidiosus TaxID=392011 RepID=A0ABY6ZPY3_9BACL|nr:carbohydrate ABC transporter permease [Alicyclobacillus fastidiosus]WAH44156.1 carbohydrate ABC transporter permease [Alicyclobacillus fastidiosus]GMA60463.1 sugar ABC transporter permease [Alicyclobacillus fastidiosus]